MKAQYLGHVVFYVRELERSLRFYRDLIGFREVGRTFGGKAAALSSGRTHHELLLIESRVLEVDRSALTSGEGIQSPAEDRALDVGDAPAASRGPRLGLYHIGIKIGDSLDELRAAKQELDQHGVPIIGMSDHTVSQSLYLDDPDGNEVELYVDADPSAWERDPSAVLSPVKPLRL